MKGKRIVIEGVPEQLRRKFKAACAEKGTTMTEVIQGVMTGVIEGEFEINEESKMLFVGGAPKKK